MNLDIDHVQEIEFVYDELDTNAISFHFPNGYFTIDTGAYLDLENMKTDPSVGKPMFEWNDQNNSSFGGLEKIVFDKKQITIVFEKKEFFLEKYKTITIHLNEEITRKIVDFFSNHLFLGKYIQYAKDFDENLKVLQTEYPEEI